MPQSHFKETAVDGRCIDYPPYSYSHTVAVPSVKGNLVLQGNLFGKPSFCPSRTWED